MSSNGEHISELHRATLEMQHKQESQTIGSSTEAMARHGTDNVSREEPVHLTRHNIASINADDVWFYLGKWGRYQVYQLMVLFTTGLTLAFPILNGVFIGMDVEHFCRHDNDSVHSNKSINTSSSFYSLEHVEVTSCTVNYLQNTSDGITVISKEKCQSFEYPANVESSYIAEWNLVCENEALSQLPQTITMVGMMVGASTLPHIGDRFGRRVLNVGSHITLMGVMVAMAFVPVFEIFVILKFVSGTLNQGLMIPNYISQLELFPTESRAIIGFIATGQWVVSVCILSPIAYWMRHSGWRYLLLVYGLFCALGFVALCLLDESLRWLLANKRVDQAERIMIKACSMNKKNYNNLIEVVLTKKKMRQIAAMESEVPLVDLPPEAATEVTKGRGKTDSTLLDLLKNPTLRMMSFIVCFAWMVNSMTYYGLTLLSTSLAGDPYINFTIGGILELPSAVFMYYLIQKLGRKNNVIILTGLAGFFLLVTVLIATLAEKNETTSALQTALSLAGKFCIAGSFNGLWIYTPELYPTNIRNSGIGISSMSARLAASVTPFFNILARKALWAPGALFTAGCVLCVFLVTFLPETSWRELPATIEEVESWFVSKKAKQKSKGKKGLSKLAVIEKD